MLQTFIDGARDFAVSYFEMNFSQFASGSYYENYFTQYFSVGGFIVGFILVLMIYFAGDSTLNKTGFIQVLAVMALTNCAARPLYMLWQFINPASHVGPAKYYDAYLSYQLDNVIAAFILLLVVFSCYKLSAGHAFLLGAVVCLSPLMLNYTYYYYEEFEFLVAQLAIAILTGLLCVVVAKRTYFYNGWILYAFFHVLAIGVTSVINYGDLDSLALQQALDQIWWHVSYDWISLALYTLILVFAFIFERVVMNPYAAWTTAKP